MKRMFYFSAGVTFGVLATRRTRRAKEAARAALAAKLTPSAIATDVADALAELGNAVGSFAADVKQGAANRRASYRPMIDGATGAVALLAPDQLGPGQLGDALAGEDIGNRATVDADDPAGARARRTA